MSSIKTSVVVDLIGNLQQKARQFEGSLTGFSRTGQRAMGALRMSATGVGRALDVVGNRYVAMATGGGITVAGKQVSDFSARLTQLGIDAGFLGEEMQAFKRDTESAIRDAATTWGVGSDQLVASLEDIVQKTGDIKFATANLDTLATTLKATGAAGSDIGRILAEFQKMGETDPQNVLMLLDTLVIQGKTGAFALRDLANEGERVFSAYTPKNIQQVREMGAVLQVMKGSRASAAETATSFDAFLRALNNAETAKRAMRAGIKLFDPEALKQGKHELLPLPTILNNIAKFSGGDRLKLGKVFTDSDSVAGLSRLLDEYKQFGKLKTLDSYLAVRGDGTQVLRDAGETLHDLNTQIVRLREGAERFASVNLSGPIGELADTLNNLDNDEIKAMYETTKDWAILLGGVIVTWKAIQAAMAATSAIRAIGGAVAGPSTTGGIAGALGGKGGPVPVYIVNAPTGVPGAPGAGGGGGKRSKLGKAGALLGRAGMVGGAVMAGWEIGTTIGDAISKNFVEGTALSDHIGRAVARGLAAMGNEEARAALKSEIEISVKTDPGTKAKITGKSDNVDTRIRSGVTQATL